MTLVLLRHWVRQGSFPFRRCGGLVLLSSGLVLLGPGWTSPSDSGVAKTGTGWGG